MTTSGVATGGGSTTTDATTGGATTGAGIECAEVPNGPFAPELVWSGYDGSEDLAFDGAGKLALKRQGEVVLVTADQQETTLAGDLPQVYGTRYAATGDLLLALPQQGTLQAISPGGVITEVAAGLQGPNGVYVDPSGGVWLTEFGGSRVVRFAADFTKTTVFEGPEASTANGVVLDPQRGLLFFTNYGAGRLLSVAVDDQGAPMGPPAEVAVVMGAVLDGLTLDACGNVYAVDQGGSQLVRVLLDAGGAAIAAPEVVATFPSNVANAQFGQGPGFEPESLYLAGNPGDVYRVAVGVPGAPIGLP